MPREPENHFIEMRIHIGPAIRSSKAPTITEAITRLVASGQRPGRGGTVSWTAFYLSILLEMGVEENTPRGFSLDYVKRIYARLKRRGELNM